MEKADKNSVTKNIPTIFPSGFGIKVKEDSDIFVLDFIDNTNPESKFVVGSFAMDLVTFENLSKSINNALKKTNKITPNERMKAASKYIKHNKDKE